MPKKLEVKEDITSDAPVVIQLSEKERLQILRKQLADLRVNSISDLDNLIAKAE